MGSFDNIINRGPGSRIEPVSKAMPAENHLCKTNPDEPNASDTPHEEVTDVATAGSYTLTHITAEQATTLLSTRLMSADEFETTRSQNENLAALKQALTTISTGEQLEASDPLRGALQLAGNIVNGLDDGVYSKPHTQKKKPASQPLRLAMEEFKDVARSFGQQTSIPNFG